MPKKKDKNKLNVRQKAFCELYVLSDKELFGNGTQCYLEIYAKGKDKKMTYKTAMVNACKLLRKTNVTDYINKLLETGGFTEENVDKQLLLLINQHGDFKSKLGAIKEFNSMKGRQKNPKLELEGELTVKWES